MVREEEEKDLGQDEAAGPTIRERRRQGRRAVFSLHVNDLVRPSSPLILSSPCSIGC